MSLTKVSYSLITGAPYNVLDYGADSSGAADSAAAIQAAINDAFTAGGGSVYIPSGTYKLTTNLTLKSNVSIFGNGTSSKLVPTAAVTLDILQGTGIANVKYSDFYLDCSATVTPGQSGMYITGFTNSEINGVTIYNAAGFGWLIFTAVNCKFLRNTINITRQWDGMTISTGSSGNIIEGNTVLNSYDSGIGFTNTVGTTCVGNYVNRTSATQGGQYYAPGIDAAGAQNAVITGNYVIGNLYGISILQHPNSGQNPKRITCTGNTIADSRYGVITGFVSVVPPATTVGVLQEIIISGNKIFSANIQGVSINGGQYITISSNDISNCSNGIYITNCSYVTISNNTSSLNTSYGINLAASNTYTNLLDNVVQSNTTGDITGILGTGSLATGNIVSSGPDYTYSLAWGSNLLGTYTVAGLPISIQGTRAFVTDATSSTFLSTAVGGGSIKTPVIYNGSNWVIG
jgi:parallel beta-helix repeat protein